MSLISILDAKSQFDTRIFKSLNLVPFLLKRLKIVLSVKSV